jgi:hypothetical protein
MPTSPRKPFLAVWALFAASALLALLLWYAAGDPDFLALAREANRDEALEKRSRALGRILDGKRQLVAELAAGRLTLAEAARQFRDLNVQFDDGNLSAHQVATGEEELCRRVLTWAESMLQGRPEQARVLSRLRAEFRARFGHDPEPFVAAPPAP